MLDTIELHSMNKNMCYSAKESNLTILCTALWYEISRDPMCFGSRENVTKSLQNILQCLH